MKAARVFVLGLASGGFVSYLPYRWVPFRKWKGAGFLGTLEGWALLWLMPSGGPVGWAWLAVLLAVSIPICHMAEKFLGQSDDPRIVFDEIAGMAVAAAGLPRSLGPLAAAFVLFRVFDVWKGPWKTWSERLPGGWGVVADDVAAGVLANLCVRLFFGVG